MSKEELVFASENAVLQHLADITGKKIIIASDSSDLFDDFETSNLKEGIAYLDSENWEDPGDYPSGAGEGPLPSSSYPVLNEEESKDAEMTIKIPENLSINDKFEIVDSKDNQKKGDLLNFLRESFDIMDLFETDGDNYDISVSDFRRSFSYELTGKPQKSDGNSFKVNMTVVAK